jgi:tetratricopeptide (TPR) repeat protein/serine/threonine protein kinase
VRLSRLFSSPWQKWILLILLFSLASLWVPPASSSAASDWYDKGIALYDLGQYNDALSAFNKALELDPNKAHAWYYKGITLRSLGQYNDALTALDKAIQLDPNKAYAWNSKGNALADLGQYSDALTAYNEALQLDPNDVYAWTNKGNALVDLGQYSDALTAYNKALQLDPNKAYTWNGKGNALTDLGQYSDALTAYNKALELDPNYAFAWNGKGNALNNLKRYDEALAALNKALELDPNNARPWNNKGNALDGLGQYSDALMAYDKALQLDPNFTLAKTNRDLVLSKQGSTSFNPLIIVGILLLICVCGGGYYFLHTRKPHEELTTERSDFTQSTQKPSRDDQWDELVSTRRKGQQLTLFAKLIEHLCDDAHKQYLQGNTNDAERLRLEAEREIKRLNDFEEKFLRWKRAGYETSSLESLKEQKNLDFIHSRFEDYEKRVARLEKVGRNLQDLIWQYNIEVKYPEIQKDVESFKNQLKNPLQISDIDRQYELIRKNVEELARSNSQRNQPVQSQIRLQEERKPMKSCLTESLKMQIEALYKQLNESEKKYNDAVTRYDPDDDIAAKYYDETAKKSAQECANIERELAGMLPEQKMEHLGNAAKWENITKNSLKPELTITLTNTRLMIDKWHKMDIKINNSGDVPIHDIHLAFSGDFEMQGTTASSMKAKESVTRSIGIKPKTEGNNPLKITASYKDERNNDYQQVFLFWIDVAGKTGFDSGETPSLSPVSPFTPKPQTPKQLPQELSDLYTESTFIGKGGFARVFKAKRKDGKYVAVKIPISIDAATGKSFIAEMQNWTKLDHSNIVRVFEYNIMPMPYFEMELCDGSLDELKKPIENEEAAWLIFNVCEGLKYTHKRSIVHRDLKPQNILLKNGTPKISDWGLSKVISDSTSTSATSFTPYYAAPEQVNNKPKDERTDIWQLGVILYELVTGALPFKGDSVVEIGMNIATKDPLRPSVVNPDSKQIEPVILKCLEKDPAKRYQSVLELQKDLGLLLRKNYAEQLTMSVSTHDFRKSAFYCGDLVMINLLTGDIATAYKYLSDLVTYAEGEIKTEAMELSEQIRNRMEYGMAEIPDELIKKAEIIVHKVSFGFRNRG